MTGDVVRAVAESKKAFYDRIDELLGEREALREALELCNGEDVRINGCGCEPGAKCYLHGRIVARALGLPDE